jgi:hypothetical protein
MAEEEGVTQKHAVFHTVAAQWAVQNTGPSIPWFGTVTDAKVADRLGLASGNVAVRDTAWASVHGARFSAEIYTRGCHWFPRLLT